jgi:hypothetical protein
MLQNNPDSPFSSSRSGIREEEDDEERSREEHSENIMKSNGWNPTTGILSLHRDNRDMKESIHEGKEEEAPKGELKLLKLHNIGKRVITMSILPEEQERMI